MGFKRPSLTALACSAVLFTALFTSSATAQYSQTPFFDQTVVQSQAYGLELALQRLNALEAVGGEFVDDFLEVVEGFEEDLPRFIGTLRARDVELAGELEEAVEALEEAAETGAGLEEAIEQTRELLGQAYGLVIPAAIRSDPVFIAALMVDLSLGEGGVGEGYEEAVEGELAEYTMGYVAVGRVTELWSEISASASQQQRDDVDEMLDYVATLYPTATIDAPIVGNPEEAEAPVQRMIGVLESVVDAELFPGRNLAALAAHLPEELAGACQAYESGEDERALEIAMGVGHLYFSADLGDFLEFMAPETHEEAAGLITALTGMGGEGDEDEEGEAEEDDEDEEGSAAADPAAADPAAACRELQEALQSASAVLGG